MSILHFVMRKEVEMEGVRRRIDEGKEGEGEGERLPDHTTIFVHNPLPNNKAFNISPPIPLHHNVPAPPLVENPGSAPDFCL